MHLSIVIVSYNTKKLTFQVIKSVVGRGEIIVVDNDSRDGSPEYLDNIFGKKIKIIKRKENGGFAKANNEGIKVASGKYILLLNSDTIVPAGTLEKMVEAMEKNPNVGLLSCRLLNEDGTFQPQGGALPTLGNIMAWWLWPVPGNVPFVDPYQNDDDIKSMTERGWIGGTAMMIRRDVIDKIGYLDEKIFMYAEDVDYCMRARKAGFGVAILPEVEITHLGSRSIGSQGALVGEIRGLLYLWGKCFPAWQKPLIRLIFIKGSLLRYLLFGILQGDTKARQLYRRILNEILK